MEENEREEIEHYYKGVCAKLGYVLNNQTKELAVEADLNPSDELSVFRDLNTALELILRIEEVYMRAGENINPGYALEKLKICKRCLDDAVEYFKKKDEEDEI